MTDTKVKLVRFHMGVHIKKMVETSLSMDSIKYKLDSLELTPIGVRVIQEDMNKIVPFTNILEIDLVWDNPKKKEPVEEVTSVRKGK